MLFIKVVVFVVGLIYKSLFFVGLIVLKFVMFILFVLGIVFNVVWFWIVSLLVEIKLVVLVILILVFLDRWIDLNLL